MSTPEITGTPFGSKSAVALGDGHVRWSRWSDEDAEAFGARVLREAEALGIAAVRFGAAGNGSAGTAQHSVEGG